MTLSEEEKLRRQKEKDARPKQKRGPKPPSAEELLRRQKEKDEKPKNPVGAPKKDRTA